MLECRTTNCDIRSVSQSAFHSENRPLQRPWTFHALQHIPSIPFLSTNSNYFAFNQAEASYYLHHHYDFQFKASFMSSLTFWFTFCEKRKFLSENICKTFSFWKLWTGSRDIIKLRANTFYYVVSLEPQ